MGAECPNGHGRQPVIQNITADFSIPKSSDDVIAHKLGCGCIIGGADLKEYQATVNKIRGEEYAAIDAAHRAAQTKIRAALAGVVNTGGDEHAE